LTARCRLRVEGRPRRAFAPRGESAAAFSAAFTLRRSNPLTPPGRSWRGRVSAASAFAELVSTSGTSMPPAFASSRRLPPEKSGAGALSDTCPGAPSPLAGGRRCCTCSSMVKRPRLDPSSHRYSRAFHGRVRFHDFCRSMFQRARQWTARASRTSGIRGRDGRRFDRSSPFDRGRPLKVRRVRGRGAPSPRRSLPGLLSRMTLPQP
jgi:hypothetical protein